MESRQSRHVQEKDRPVTPSSGPPFDLEAHRDLLAEENLSQAEETELLALYANIMGTFARLGWGLEPIQTLLMGPLESAWRAAQDSVEPEESVDCDQKGETCNEQ